ncbi:MAG: response regulator, partial [Rhizobiales bacterium]|nr:response regulator [Hyphomicrobiales bacterium]
DLPMGTESILVVEDDALVRENTQRQLLSLGYRVLVVGNGREALRQLSVGYRPDLLLTDVILGGEMNGKELADKVRVIDPGIRVMFMSGYTSGVLADPVTGVIPESMNFIGKPFRRSQLARSVRDALESGTTLPA